MKCTIPEISWHNRDPVLSVDIQTDLSKGIYKLATGGTDSHVIIWHLSILDNGGISVEMLSDLTRHNRAVNAVRFSPDGQYLASSDDESALIIWKKNENSTNDIFMEDKELENKENWIVFKMLRGHIEDVSDLCWSSCSQYLVSGSVDNSAIIWDIQKGKNIGLLKDHKGFVQGVAWDPCGQYIATICSDRILRFHNIASKKVVQKVLKVPLSPVLSETDQIQKLGHLFHDDTLKSFCRRLSFSPDGEFIAVPSGILESEEGNYVNCTHIFSRLCLSRPVMCFPTKNKCTIAVRWCPTLFELRIDSKNENESSFTNMFDLPYRMVFAVATQNAIFIHDTQQPIPFARISEIHYTRLSDISWSADGRILAASSTDGYCSLVSFKENELGIPYKTKKADEPMDLVDTMTTSTEQCSSTVSDENGQQKSLKRSVANSTSSEKSLPSKNELETNDPKTPTPIAVKRAPTSTKGRKVPFVTLTSSAKEPIASTSKTLPVPFPASKSQSISKNEETTSCADKNTANISKPVTPKTPRRVPLITLSSPKCVVKRQTEE